MNELPWFKLHYVNFKVLLIEAGLTLLIVHIQSALPLCLQCLLDPIVLRAPLPPPLKLLSCRTGPNLVNSLLRGISWEGTPAHRIIGSVWVVVIHSHLNTGRNSFNFWKTRCLGIHSMADPAVVRNRTKWSCLALYVTPRNSAWI